MMNDVMFARNEDTHESEVCETTDDHRLKVDALIGSGTLALVSNETPNDNDKVIVVPAGSEYQILWILVEYTSDDIQGTRQLEIRVRDRHGDLIGDFRAGATQANSVTRYYMFAPTLADLTAFRDTDYLMSPIPPTLFLPAGYDLLILDNNDVSDNDDMIIQMMVFRK